jgi:16S rRNA (guanine966-N2)-methyltransferase
MGRGETKNGKATAKRSPRAARSTIRISAGRWKGRRVNVPQGARPTSSRAREALFDVLGDAVRGARLLDLYAGSGAIGFEAISRGAAAALLVDRDTRSIEASLARLGADGLAARAVRGEALTVARELADRGERFDLIFCDPPYGEILPKELGAVAGRLLDTPGLLVLQQDEDALAPHFAGLELRATRPYGRNVFRFFAPAPPRF